MYVGTLQHDPSSRLAVTGCLNNPGDVMDITLLSKNSAHQMFTVDYFGNSNAIPSPLNNKGKISIYDLLYNDGFYDFKFITFPCYLYNDF